MRHRSVNMLKAPKQRQKFAYILYQLHYRLSLMRYDQKIGHTRLMHLLSFPVKCHGRRASHSKAAISSDTTPQSAIKPVNAHPNLRCMLDAVKIMRSDIIDNFARVRVAM